MVRIVKESCSDIHFHLLIKFIISCNPWTISNNIYTLIKLIIDLFSTQIRESKEEKVCQEWLPLLCEYLFHTDPLLFILFSSPHCLLHPLPFTLNFNRTSPTQDPFPRIHLYFPSLSHVSWLSSLSWVLLVSFSWPCCLPLFFNLFPLSTNHLSFSLLHSLVSSSFPCIMTHLHFPTNVSFLHFIIIYSPSLIPFPPY